jgi:hypothetical protein
MMAARMRDAGIPALNELRACGITQAHIEQYRLDRLFELRAMIDSLRAESGGLALGPPLRHGVGSRHRS